MFVFAKNVLYTDDFYCLSSEYFILAAMLYSHWAEPNYTSLDTNFGRAVSFVAWIEF